MKNPTFQEQYNKIVDAYYKDKLEPYNNCACFVGNLLNGIPDWAIGRGPIFGIITQTEEYRKIAEACIMEQAHGFYTLQEILNLEKNFMHKYTIDFSGREKGLFQAMSSTLDLLRGIHESKGEMIETFNFQKREKPILYVK